MDATNIGYRTREIGKIVGFLTLLVTIQGRSGVTTVVKAMRQQHNKKPSHILIRETQDILLIFFCVNLDIHLIF